MHDLKKRLEPVKLTDVQKERIIRNVKEGKGEKVSLGYQKGPFIASIIVGVAMLFLVFNLLMEPETIFQSGSSQAAEQEQNERNLNWEIAIWNTVTVVIMILSIIQTRKTMLQVKRWQSNKIVIRLKPLLESKSKSSLLMFVLAVSIWGGSFLCNWLLIYTHIWVAILFILGIFMLEAYHTREYEKTRCPHCQIQFTRKQIRQKTKWQFREKCDACEKPIFVDPNRNGTSGYLFIYPLFIVFNSFLNIHYVIVITMIVTLFWLVYKYISPYSIQFIAEQKEDPKLW